MTSVCIKAVVSGEVQGVFFRASTVEQAASLKITGWVKNRSDGDVELVACGDQQHITQFIDWLWQGPAAAKVMKVQWEKIPPQSFDQFKVQY